MEDKVIAVVAGSAAEALRLAPFLLVHEQTCESAGRLLIAGGPEQALVSRQLGEFELQADREAPYEGTSIYPCELAGRGLTRLGEILSTPKPSLVLVAGESDAALAAAQAAFHLDVPLLYLNESSELRDSGLSPRETRRRRLLVHLAAGCAVPHVRIRLGLCRDGVPEEKIAVVGASAVDSIMVLGSRLVGIARTGELASPVGPASGRPQDLGGKSPAEGPRLLVMTLPTGNARADIVTEFCLAARDLTGKMPDLRIVVPMPRWAEGRQLVVSRLEGAQRIAIADIAGPRDRMQLVSRANLVLGVDRRSAVEAAALGVPALPLSEIEGDGRRSSKGPARDIRARVVSRVSYLLRDPVALRVLAETDNLLGDGDSGLRLQHIVANLLKGHRPLLPRGEEFDTGAARRQSRARRKTKLMMPAPNLLQS